MDHFQFEMQVAAILTAGIAQAKGATNPADVVTLLADVHKEITSRAVIEKKNATFIPKGR
ncbi:MAG: hypothetical protein ACTHPD_13160 [Rhizomicrobium sp.]